MVVKIIGNNETAARARTYMHQGGGLLVEHGELYVFTVMEGDGDLVVVDGVDSPLEARFVTLLAELLAGGRVLLDRGGKNRDDRALAITVPRETGAREAVALAIYRATAQLSGPRPRRGWRRFLPMLAALLCIAAPAAAQGSGGVVDQGAAGTASWPVTCTSGCSGSGGGGLTDNSTFTIGTTSFSPIGGVFKDAATLLADGVAAAARLTAYRAVHTNLRNASGVEIGVAGSALIVDGSAVTQPISASTLPLPTGAATLAKQPALGTAGAAAADVITVQGIASMTPLTAQPATTVVTHTFSATGDTFSIDVSAAASVTISLSGGFVSAGFLTFQGPNGNIIAAVRTATSGAQSTATSINVTSDSGTELYSIGCASLQTLKIVSSGTWASSNILLTARLSTVEGILGRLVLVGQGTAASVANAWPAKITDGTNTSAVKAASTAAVAADAALVVAVSPNNTVKVDGSAVTQPVSGTVTTTPPSNASTNIAQINAVTPLMGNGVSGTGALRVALASDNSAVSGLGAGATGSAPPANAIFQGARESTNLVGMVQCDKTAQATISSATTTSIVAISASTAIFVCSYVIEIQGVATTAGTMQLESGTGAACVTTHAAITPTYTGSTTAGNPTVVVQTAGNGYLFKTPAANALCAVSTTTTPQQVFVTYAQF